MQHARCFWALAVVFALGACDCNGGDTGARGLEIIAPPCGSTLSLADDEDPATEGLQLTVIARATRLDVGEDVSLYLDSSASDEDPPVATASIDDASMAMFVVTVPPGTHSLQARAREGGVVSPACPVSVSDSCAGISFVSPERDPAASRVTLGGTDDTDGMACGDTFETEVVVTTTAPDGTTAQIFVNGTPRGTTTVDAMIARFRDVVLDNRGDTPNTIEVEVDLGGTASCRSAYPVPVHVDCAGVSCAIAIPDTGSAYLNQSDDTSAAEGFQTDFEVATDMEALGQPVRLVIDSDEDGAREALPMEMGGVRAVFGNVPLTEGLHRVQAECRDDAGNLTRSGVAEWTVDITPCDVTISAPAADAVLSDALDEDGATEGIQTTVSGDASGVGCEEVRVAPCSAIDSTTFGALAGGSFSELATLSTSPMQELCAQVRDEAGNVGEARVPIRVLTDAPQLQITDPTGTTRVNKMGGTFGGETYIADLNATTDQCEVGLTVACSEPGETVTLVQDGSTTPIAMATATCMNVGGTPPLVGEATFSSVALPALAMHTIRARMSVAGLVGLSDPVSLLTDCNPPTLAINRPTCGASLRPAVQDEDTSTPGFQYQVDVQNPETPYAASDLTIRSGGSAVYSSSTPLRTGAIDEFPNADFSAGGTLSIESCATDSFGNTGCTAACSVMVEDLPAVTITTPLDMAILGAANDCDGGTAGMQVRVRATTDAPDGSSAMVSIGSSGPVPTTVSGGQVDVCMDAPQGSGLVVSVTVTDSRGMGTGMVSITVDSLAPTDPIDDLAIAAVADRRGGIVSFQWTAVDDAGGGRLTSYELRCGSAAITNETRWMNATVYSVMVAPATGGTMQVEMVSGFRLGPSYQCALRGTDAAGALTPLGNSLLVELDFLEHVVAAPAGATARMGLQTAPAGDVNGDGIDDVLIAGLGSAFLYFGSATGLATTPSVRFEGDSGTHFGARVAGLGDFNGDGIADFAISARLENANRGAVYVFFGRSSATPWPATVTIGSTGCDADLCFRPDDGAAGSGADEAGRFGWSVAPAGDFDGDGYFDLVVGAPTALGNQGVVYVLLGTDTATGAVRVPADSPRGFLVDAGVASLQFGGWATTVGGNAIGDARHDLVIAGSGSSTMSINSALYALAGRAHTGTGMVNLTGAALTTVMTAAGGVYGTLVQGIGDYDGDGRLDIAARDLSTAGGQVQVFLGTAAGFAGMLIYVNNTPNAAVDQYGLWIGMGEHPWLGTIGDLDGDLLTDLLVSSWEYSTESGSVHAFYGASPAAARPRSASEVFLQPAPTTSGLPRFVNYAGDLDGDGFTDIAVGDPFLNSNDGRLVVYY